MRRFTLAPDDLNSGEFTRNAAISPDGRFIAYLAGPMNSNTLWLHDLATDSARELNTPADSVIEPFWSPDSRFVAYRSGGEIKRFSIEGGVATTICEVATARWFSGAWSPGGDSIVFSDRSEGAWRLYKVPARGGTPELLFEVPEARAEEYHVDPHFLASPGNDILLYSANKSADDGRIVVRNQRTGRELDVGAGFPEAYSPSGHILYRVEWEDNTIWALPFSIERMAVAGEPFPVTQGARHASVANDGTLVYFDDVKGGLQQLVWRDRTGRKVGEIGQPQATIFLPSLSPDGRYVGVEGVETNTGEDIWLHDVERPIKTRFTFDKARESRCMWSPDGRQIAFWSSRAGDNDIYIKPTDGSAEARLLHERALVERWSPDGKFLLMQKSGDIWTVRPDGNDAAEPQPFLDSEFVENAPTFSPDGRFVTYSSNESGSFEVYVRPFPEGAGKWQVSQSGGSQSRWSRDGKEIFYVKDDTLYSAAVSMEPNFSVGEVTELFSDPGLGWEFHHPTYDVSHDGRRFITIETLGDDRKPRIRVVQNWFEEFRGR